MKRNTTWLQYTVKSKENFEINRIILITTRKNRI